MATRANPPQNVTKTVTVSGTNPNYVFASNTKYVGAGGGKITSGKLPNGWHDIIVSGVEITGTVSVGSGQRLLVEKCNVHDISGHAFTVREGNTSDLEFTGNRFAYIGGYGVIEAYNVPRLTWTRNEAIDCAHFGHLLGCTHITWSNNWAEGLLYWGCEVQDNAKVITENNTFENNVFHLYRKGFGNTGGVGMPGGQSADDSQGNVVRNNYLVASFKDGAVLSEGHMHVAVEVTNWWFGEVSNNIIGSVRPDGYVWHGAVGYKTPDVMTGNKFFGRFGSDSLGWKGNPLAVWPKAGNSWDSNPANIPPLPNKQNVLGGTVTPPPPPPPPPPPIPTPGQAPSNVTISNVTDRAATVKWTDNTPDEVKFMVTFMPDDPKDAVRLDVPANQTSVELDLNPPRPNWKFNVTVEAYTPGGALKSAAVPLQLKPSGTPPPPPPPVKTVVGFSGAFKYSDSSSKSIDLLSGTDPITGVIVVRKSGPMAEVKA